MTLVSTIVSIDKLFVSRHNQFLFLFSYSDAAQAKMEFVAIQRIDSFISIFESLLLLSLSALDYPTRGVCVRACVGCAYMRVRACVY